MGVILETLTRLLTWDNRRRHQRQRRTYDTIIRNEGLVEVFHGKTLDISRGGAKVMGWPKNKGVREGQRVTVEFLLVPKDVTVVAQRAPVPARVVRVHEREDEFVVAVQFEKTLPGS